MINAALNFVTRNDLEVMKAEMETPKRVEFTSVGVKHSWPVDGVNTKIVRSE